MTADVTKSYRGVLCARCRQPVAVSAKIGSLPDELEDQEQNIRAFIARCKMCVHENIYSISEIQVFTGEPRKRSLRARAVAI